MVEIIKIVGAALGGGALTALIRKLVPSKDKKYDFISEFHKDLNATREHFYELERQLRNRVAQLEQEVTKWKDHYYAKEQKYNELLTSYNKLLNSYQKQEEKIESLNQKVANLKSQLSKFKKDHS